MEHKNITTPAPAANWSRWAYGIFTLAGLLFWLLGDDRSMAFTFLALAPIADPFDQRVGWKERPLWQRAWLVVHLGLTAAALGWWMGLMDRA